MLLQFLYLPQLHYAKSAVERKVEKLSPARYVVDSITRLAALVTLCVVLAVSFSRTAEARYASIVVDAENGNVLHAANPDKRTYPASLTKVMTLYMLFDALEQGRLKLTDRLPVSSHAAAQSPSKLGLIPGERIAVEDVVMALVTKSANDAAVVAAEGLGGTEADFAEMMTRKAHAIGMGETTYRNASGLPNPGQVTTARDQATLARSIIRHHAKYYHYFSARQFKWKNQPISTHNRLMLRYPGADGLKTGYIHASGFNLISSAKRDGKRVVGVVMGGDTAVWRDNHMAKLLDKGFARLDGGGTYLAEADDDLPKVDELKAAVRKAKAKDKETVALAANAATKAKAAPAKAAAKAEEMGDIEPDAWSIQVGAFAENKAARRAAAAAARKLGGLVSRATVDVDKVKQGKDVLFRSRLTGFTEDQARTACKRLERAKKSCRVVQPSA